MESVEIKACKKCGGRPTKFIFNFGTRRSIAYVCFCQPPQDTEEVKAINKWNEAQQ